jgi:hypothetical protein
LRLPHSQWSREREGKVAFVISAETSAFIDFFSSLPFSNEKKKQNEKKNIPLHLC